MALQKVKRVLDAIKSVIISVATILGVVALIRWFRPQGKPKPINPGDVICSPDTGDPDEADHAQSIIDRMERGKK